MQYEAVSAVSLQMPSAEAVCGRAETTPYGTSPTRRLGEQAYSRVDKHAQRWRAEPHSPVRSRAADVCSDLRAGSFEVIGNGMHECYA